MSRMKWWKRTSEPPRRTCSRGGLEQALTLIEAALREATSLRAATLLPSAHRVNAAALFASGVLAQARTALAEGLRHSSSPEVGYERGFLLAIAARIAHSRQDPDADQLEEEARAALQSLGVVRVPLPESPVIYGWLARTSWAKSKTEYRSPRWRWLCTKSTQACWFSPSTPFFGHGGASFNWPVLVTSTSRGIFGTPLPPHSTLSHATTRVAGSVLLYSGSPSGP